MVTVVPVCLLALYSIPTQSNSIHVPSDSHCTIDELEMAMLLSLETSAKKTVGRINGLYKNA